MAPNARSEDNYHFVATVEAFGFSGPLPVKKMGKLIKFATVLKLPASRLARFIGQFVAISASIALAA